MLHGRASLRPDDLAFTFTDFSRDWAGVPERLTWSQLARRTMNVAREIRRHGAVGDRAVILAPQGMEYILAFLGAMQAGLIAVPLPLPHPGSGHERVDSVLADTAPTVVLTTSSAAADVGDFVGGLDTTPTLIEIDSVCQDDDGVVELTELPDIAYLQYSSGSTRAPTGVMISHRNLQVNFEQVMGRFLAGVSTDATFVSWLPFYHDMGLVLGICAPILSGIPAALTSPTAFLERPARWMQALAENPRAFSAAPNFAFDLAARKTVDSDLDGLDLGGVRGIINGAERVDPATLERFADRFSHFNFESHMLCPSYGLAEATVFVTAGSWSDSVEVARFDVDELSAGRAQRCDSRTGSALVSYELPKSPVLCIADSETSRECAPDVVGEIWVHGENVADGYWGRPPGEQSCFGATLVDPSPGTPVGPWLRTGDLGFVHGGELFIVGRIKDLLIIRGRNHYPEDIEATVQEITGGRVAAVAVPGSGAERLVTVIELKKPADLDDDAQRRLAGIKSDVTAAISNAHGLSVEDLVLVPAGSLPTTTSGKVRRAACVELYQRGGFDRLDGARRDAAG
ncbi:acyl-CoA synthetase [Mycolicibacterium flavescens]|uniref:Acyl-CoA synthetase n=1 Tax=Mycolicibacterium flavescens TaxID=1776 RepID=A0A1E3RPD2_MYCFV|nr:acyl-CoA synthetase [Mycolicibacterium flavescens]